jgi:hypothetical protein
VWVCMHCVSVCVVIVVCRGVKGGAWRLWHHRQATWGEATGGGGARDSMPQSEAVISWQYIYLTVT